MNPRIDEIELPRLRQLQEECPWFHLGRILGQGSERLVSVEYDLRAFAWQEGELTPTIRSGPWDAQFVLTRGMALQPLVRILPNDERYLPVSGNISDWSTRGDPRRAREAIPGLVCYADRWSSDFTLVWLAYQIARIIVGEVLNLESRPLSLCGRDFQAEALARGELPTQAICAPSAAILLLHASVEEPCRKEIEFDDD
jgi:hypothetical protein